MLFLRLIHPTFHKEIGGSPKFLMPLSLHATLSDPGSPSESHHSDSPVLASGTLTPSPTASFPLTGLNCFGEARLPCGLQCSLCTLHPYCSSRIMQDSATGATLDMGCWLGFAQWGLSPHKKHQAALGALTFEFTCILERSGKMSGATICYTFL